MADEQDKRIPLIVMPENRDTSTSKDAKLVNCYMEAKGKTVYVYKRAGTLAAFSHGASAGMGCYNWKGDVYSIFGGYLYKGNGGYIGSVMDTTGGVYSFNQSLGPTNYMVMQNGVNGYTYDGTTLAQIADADYPVASVKGISYLDQTTYVMTAKAAIQGSAIANPTSWDPLNVLTAQIEPDGGIAIAKQLVYVVAFKQWSTELFYDAANATGSPLATVQGAKVNYGCLSADTVQDIDGKLFWVATNRNSSPQVLMMEKVSAEVISDHPMDRLLTNAKTSDTFYSFSFKDAGHQFYVLTDKTLNITMVYDVAEKVWSQWTDASGNYLPFVSSTFDASGNRLWQHESDGHMYYASKSYLTDNGTIITADIYTPNFDGGTSKRKHLNRLFFVGDQVTGSILQVRVSDDDYQTWTNFRSVDLGVKRPYLDRCGSFYKRAFHLRHAKATAFRLSAMEHQIELGTL